MTHSPSPISPSPLLVSVPEAGRLLGIGRTLASGLVASGQIPSVRIGRRVLVPVAAIASFVDERAAAAGRPAAPAVPAWSRDAVPAIRRPLGRGRRAAPHARLAPGTKGVVRPLAA